MVACAGARHRKTAGNASGACRGFGLQEHIHRGRPLPEFLKGFPTLRTNRYGVRPRHDDPHRAQVASVQSP